MSQSMNLPQNKNQLHLKLIDHTRELLDLDIAYIVQLLMDGIYNYTNDFDKIEYTYIVLRMIVLAKSISSREISITDEEMETIITLLREIGEDDGQNSTSQTKH